jgi:hypothetical protein
MYLSKKVRIKHIVLETILIKSKYINTKRLEYKTIKCVTEAQQVALTQPARINFQQRAAALLLMTQEATLQQAVTAELPLQDAISVAFR